MRVKMSKQPQPAPTASAVGPCPTEIQIVGRPGTRSLPSTIAPPDHPLIIPKKHELNLPRMCRICIQLASTRCKHVPSFITLAPGRVAQSVGHLTRKSGVLGSIPGLATYFRFSFRFFKKGSCQLLAKVCARSTG